jgi:sucrose-6-phosphate hydrolase SacC (GH32 family)
MQAPTGNTMRIRTSMTRGNARESGWKLQTKDNGYITIGVDWARSEMFLDRTHAGLDTFSPQFPARTAAPLRGNHTRIGFEILIDRNSIEVFADEGRVVMTNLIFPKADWQRIEFYSNGAAKQTGVRIWPLKPSMRPSM